MTEPMNLHTSRESWLRAAADAVRPIFEAAGNPLPSHMRFSIGFPSAGRRGRIVAECWNAAASADGVHEIFIRPDQAEPAEILGTLIHELVHAALPDGELHGKLFKKLATAIGLEGPMKSAEPGKELADRLNQVAVEIGPIPHAKLSWGVRRKQGTRLIKTSCFCGYNARVTRKWLDTIGAPYCPEHGPMLIAE